MADVSVEQVAVENVEVKIRAYRGVWRMFGFAPETRSEAGAAGATPARPSLSGRKRLRRVTRIILAVLPRRLQSAIGYPLSTSIGCSLSPEIRISPTKPCGKGNKRKQDELDEDEEEPEQQTWVDALTQELAENEGSDEDPDYQPSMVETESEEYCSQNNTESDIEVTEQGVVIIEEVVIAESMC
ncbi:unnamed protein product [Merluccius merluccius]